MKEKIKEIMKLLEDVDLTNRSQMIKSQKKVNKAYKMLEELYKMNN